MAVRTTAESVRIPQRTCERIAHSPLICRIDERLGLVIVGGRDRRFVRNLVVRHAYLTASRLEGQRYEGDSRIPLRFSLEAASRLNRICGSHCWYVSVPAVNARRTHSCFDSSCCSPACSAAAAAPTPGASTRSRAGLPSSAPCSYSMA